MILRIGVLASRIAGYKLDRNIPTNAASSNDATSAIVKFVTTGFGTKISNVAITPRDIPTAKLEIKTIMLWIIRMAKTAFGLVPTARKTANSCLCSSNVKTTNPAKHKVVVANARRGNNIMVDQTDPRKAVSFSRVSSSSKTEKSEFVLSTLFFNAEIIAESSVSSILIRTAFMP